MTRADVSKSCEFLGFDPNLQMALEKIPSALIGWELKDFYCGNYNKSLLIYEEKNHQTLKALQCFCDENPSSALAAQRQCCTALLAAIEKEMPQADQFFHKQARAMQLDHYRMVIVSYFNPLVFEMNLAIGETLPHILQEEWLARYPKYRYQLVTKEMVSAGFERCWYRTLRRMSVSFCSGRVG